MNIFFINNTLKFNIHVCSFVFLKTNRTLKEKKKNYSWNKTSVTRLVNRTLAKSFRKRRTVTQSFEKRKNSHLHMTHNLKEKGKRRKNMEKDNQDKSWKISNNSNSVSGKLLYSRSMRKRDYSQSFAYIRT